MRRALWLGGALVLACGPQLKPETLVDKLRVLSITAEPPEVRPGQSAQLGVLQLDPSRPGGKTTVIWVGCDPDPFGLGRSACNDTSALLQPTSFTTFPDGVRILGIGNRASYAAAASLFDPISPGDSNRFNGVVGQILAVVIGEEIDPTSTNEELRVLFERIERQEVQSVYALTRITVSEKAEQNHNPRLLGLEVAGAALPPNATLAVRPGEQVKLRARATEPEQYTLQVPSGFEARTEKLVGAWYSTAGRFGGERFEVGGEVDAVFTAPGAREVPDDPVPAKRFGTAWLVLRDERGGQAFEVVPWFVCDDSLREPEPTSVELSPAGVVTVRGPGMSSALDVVANGVALQRGFYSSAQDAFLGDLPPQLGSGSYPLTVRTKRCTTRETALQLTVP